jgi:triacylglycerol lipase
MRRQDTPLDASCQTNYPIVLIHGAGFRDLKWPVYWGRIPGALERRGARVFYGLQDCWASTETNAREIVRRIDEILRQTGAQKVNLIAHSKGGLEARMAASSLKAGDRIASITTIATPHRGSKTIDRLFGAPKMLFDVAAFAVNNWIRVVGDRKPDFLAVCKGFTTEQMVRFNRENPDVPGVFYQSFGCVMAHPLSDINLSTANFVLNRIEGENDGLVSVSSAEWGERFTVLRGVGRRGISHLDAIDLRRRPFSRKQGEGVKDICEVYVAIAADLKRRGF